MINITSPNYITNKWNKLVAQHYLVSAYYTYLSRQIYLGVGLIILEQSNPKQMLLCMRAAELDDEKIPFAKNSNYTGSDQLGRIKLVWLR
jgi:hypothetical protein